MKLVLVTLLLLLVPGKTFAVGLVVVSEFSTLKISFQEWGGPGRTVSSPQFLGSDTTHLGGTIFANITSGSLNSIELLPSTLSILNELAPMQPLPGGAPGQAIAQFGWNIDYGVPFNGAVAARNLELGISGGPLVSATNSFSTNSIQFDLFGGEFDYDLLSYGSPLVGQLPVLETGFNSSGDATLQSSFGGFYTLTIPINFTFLVDGVPLIAVVTGEIVAADIPEPSTWVLGAFGLLALVAGGYREVARRSTAG